MDYEEYICYSMEYIEEENIIRICEFDANCMPSHAAIDDISFCVSKNKNNLILIANKLYPNCKIDYISWKDN